ncbi:MAG: SMP-30/gluconolactonase/LRE family protein [Bacteroidota bacterium]|nr:SMP-30/gluconolactonase/LRE family protein [Bacteroidota bacterium]|tara:strand:+ start:527 stop:1543 length:1017 start_codon:yes stop_codon:yes gene_type:complete
MKKYILSFFLLSILSCVNNTNQENYTRLTRGNVQIFDESAKIFVNEDSRIELLADSLFLSEGPLWIESLNSLLFTQVASNKVFKWNENDGLSVYLDPSGYTGIVPAEPDGLVGSNGMVLNSNGDLILAQHGDRRVAKLIDWDNETPEFETLAGRYNDKLFNSPNDLVYADNGDLYFTDPPYGFGLEKLLTSELKEQPVNGVYKLTKTGEVVLLVEDILLPNGVAISNDNKTLYVNSSDVEYPIITKFDITENGLENREIFFDGTELIKSSEGWFDGLKVHSSGNIFSTGPGGVLILTPEGKHLATIGTTSNALNCAFGNNEEYLYITAFDYLARVKLN